MPTPGIWITWSLASPSISAGVCIKECDVDLGDARASDPEVENPVLIKGPVNPAWAKCLDSWCRQKGTHELAEEEKGVSASRTIALQGAMEAKREARDPLRFCEIQIR